jgi:hypothetical protein
VAVGAVCIFLEARKVWEGVVIGFDSLGDGEEWVRLRSGPLLDGGGHLMSS